ncbi:MAG: serine/threonine-protein kinase [Acidobacteriota bacterium]
MTDGDSSTGPRGEAADFDRRLYALIERVVAVPEAEREAILAASEPDLAREVRLRLAAREERGDDFLVTPSLVVGPAELPRQVGPYRLVELLGEGGMGRVYRGQQTAPVEREVAVKILRFPSSGRARFSAEMFAMGRLAHPNVGKILEAGTTDQGEPFFAMELIDGAPITNFCDQRALSLEARLGLLIEVCRGVEHAHRKLLLHRDIKPSNVLVTEIDQRPVPKLIDFGIAKGLDGALAGDTLATGDRLVGTPAYMSPEALGLGGDVDTRSDVYSLGVLLFELLTGHLPWPEQSLATATLERSADVAVTRPSTRVSGLEPGVRGEAARQRSLQPPELTRRLRGDLDWITLKALAFVPGERYASAGELANDLERFLANQPVTARAPSTGYLLRKLARRHRGRFIAAAVVLVALAIGMVGTTLGLLRANREAERANVEAAEAQRARQSSDQLADYFVDLFTVSEGTDDVSQTTAAELLNRSGEALGSRLKDQPRARGVLLSKLAGIYAEWGELDRADRLLQESSALLERADGDTRSERVDALGTWISVHWKRARYDDAVAVAEEALRLHGEVDDGQDTVRRVQLLAEGAIAALYTGRTVRVKEWLEESEELLAGLPAEAPGVFAMRSLTDIGWGGLAYLRQEWRDGIELYRRAADTLERQLGPEHRRLTVLWTFIGNGEIRLGELVAAEQSLQRSLALGERYSFSDGYKLPETLGAFGRLRRAQGRYEEAEDWLRRSLETRRQRLPPDHPALAEDLHELAWTIWQGDPGRAPEAIDLLEAAAALLERSGAKVYRNGFEVPQQLATVYLAVGRPARAEVSFRRACALVASLEEPLASDLGDCHLGLGRSLAALGRSGEARTALQQARARFRDAEAPGRLDEVTAELAKLPRR